VLGEVGDLAKPLQIIEVEELGAAQPGGAKQHCQGGLVVVAAFCHHGPVCLLLCPVHLLEREVTHWEREADTQVVDGLIHEVSLQLDQGQGVGNSGKVVALGRDGLHLPMVAVGCFEASQVLDLHIAGLVLHLQLVPLPIRHHYGMRVHFIQCHCRSALLIKVEVDGVVFAL